MIIKTVKRYYCDCGKGFFKKSACESHEQNCKSWKNPKNKACKTCIYGQYIKPEYDQGYIMTDGYFDCKNDNVDEHSGAPNDINYISQNCIFWECKQ
jgi:hypothetical protein